MTEQDKEEVINFIVNGQNLLSARQIHQALPQYEEEELIALLNDDDFYNELARRMHSIKSGKTRW